MKVDKLFSFVLFTVLQLFIVATLEAQTIDKRTKLVPDTLALADRFSVRTNTVDWLLLTPNIGVEYELRGVEWNHWAIGMNFRYNWQTNHTYQPAQVYNIAEAKADVRYYWRTRSYYSKSERQLYSANTKKRNIFKRLTSTLRDSVLHPNATYYRGAFLAYSKYSFLLFGNKGYQGNAITAGLTIGMIKPLYQFAGGNSIDLDMGLNLGVCFTENDEYFHDRESDCYPLVKHNDWSVVPFPVLNEARIAFVYRMGTRSMMHKYRWRYDVEQRYRERMDSIMDDELKRIETERTNRKYLEGMDAHFERIYNKVYADTLVTIRQRMANEEKQQAQQAAAKKMAEEQRKQEAARIKEENKKLKKQAKEEKPSEEQLPKTDEQQPQAEEQQPQAEEQGKEEAK